MSNVWIMRQKEFYLGERDVHAKYIEGSARLKRGLLDFGIRSSQQIQPFDRDIWMTLDLADDFPQLDLLRTNYWFLLASKQLLEILNTFQIPYETFNVHWVRGNWPTKSYVGIHLLPKLVDVLDVEASEFTKIPFAARRVVLKNIPQEPYTMCDKTYQCFVHDDFKLAAEQLGLTGIRFLWPDETGIGRFAPIPKS